MPMVLPSYKLRFWTQVPVICVYIASSKNPPRSRYRVNTYESGQFSKAA